MPNRLRSHLTYANVLSTLCLFLLLGGAAYAATGLSKDSVGSREITAGAVRNAELADNAVTSPKVKDGSLLEADFAPGQLPAGPKGEPGAPGADGARGADGSPDTPAQVRDKLAQVDGSGSGIDADAIDGIDSGGLGRVIYRSSQSFDPPNLTPGACESFPLAPPNVNLHSSDSVILTPSEFTFFPLQYTGGIRASVGFIYGNVCNNGGTAFNEGPMTLNFMVIR
jgi:hypothetical protein